MDKKMISFLALVLFLGHDQAALAEMKSDSYTIPRTVVSGGGAVMVSDSHEMKSTLGQSSPLMAPSDPPVSTGYSLLPGFWYVAEDGIAPCTGDLDWDGDVDGVDLAALIETTTPEELPTMLPSFAANFGKVCAE